MKFNPHLKVLILGLGLAFAATQAGADGWGYATNGDSYSQEGWGSTSIGADNNPRGLDPSLTPDPEGLSPYRQPVSHTPTGAMYNVPWYEPESTNTISGSIDLTGQWTNGTKDSALFNTYRDMSDGGYIGHFGFAANGNGNSYMNVDGGNVARTDQYYEANFGVYNDFKVHAYYDELEHVYDSNARLIFNGAGTNTLTLVPGLQFTGQNTGATYAGGATGQPQSILASQVAQNILANTAESTIEQDRKKGGIRIDKVLDDNWSVYSGYSLERRTGDMPYGQDGGFFPGAFNLATPAANASEGRPVEVPYPIDFMEHVGIAGTAWSDRQNAFNAQVHVSLFDDGNKQVTWENPYDQPAINVNQHIMNFSTFPDNQEGDIKLDYKHAFDGLWNSVFTNTAYFATQRNDDPLLPNMTTTGWSGATAVPSGVNYTYYNSLYVNPTTNTPCSGPSVAGCLPTLSQSTTDVHNNNWMYNAKWSIHPIEPLALNAGFRWYDQVNSNNYTAFNPACAVNEGLTAAQQTGQPCGAATAYGLENENGNLADIPGTTTSIADRIRSFNTTFKQVDTTVGADYQIAPKDSATLNYTYETYDYAMRERSQTNEDQFKLTLTSKEITAGTLRVSGEYDHKTGSAWNQYAYLETLCPAYYTSYSSCFPLSNPTTAFAGLGALDTSIDGVKYDLADRNQYTLIGRFNYMLTSDLDAMVTAKDQMQMYSPGPYGRESRQEQNYNVELNWQPTTTTNFYIWDSWETMHQDQADADNNTSTCSNAAFDADQCNWQWNAPNSVVGIVTNYFTERTTDNDNVVGVGFGHLFPDRMKFDASLQYTGTTTTVDYQDYCVGARINPLTHAAIASGCIGTSAALNNSATPDYSFFDGVLYPSNLSLPETYNRITLKLGLAVPITQNASLGFSYVFDHADEDDFHYDGLAGNNDVEGTRYYLSPDPGNGFQDQTFMISLRYKM